MKAYKKTIILTTILTLLPMLAGLLLWNRLPEQVPSHWGFDGQVDGWSSRAQAVFFLPCLLAAVQLVLIFCTFADPKKKNIHPKMLLVVMWIIPVLSILMSGVTYLTALGVKISMTMVMMLLIGMLFLVLGNYLPKVQQNYTVGIRVSWALADEDNWVRTHRFAGKVMVFVGILLILLAFAADALGDKTSLILLIVLALSCSLIPVFYSYLIYKKKN